MFASLFDDFRVSLVVSSMNIFVSLAKKSRTPLNPPHIVWRRLRGWKRPILGSEQVGGPEKPVLHEAVECSARSGARCCDLLRPKEMLRPSQALQLQVLPWLFLTEWISRVKKTEVLLSF